jgi:putative spermidine/putrescine transport system substrate-binding protein
MLRLRNVTAAATLALLVTGSAACGSGDAGPGGGGGKTVTLLGYAGVFQDNYVKAVVEPFQKEHPDIKVRFRPSQNSAETLATLRAQKGRPDVDVAIMDISVAQTGNKEKIFAPLDPAKVPNLADVAERGKVADNYGPAVTFDNLVLVYNTDKVKTAPTSWNALWDPAYKGKVAIPAAPDIQGLSLSMIANKMAGADYKNTLDPAVAKLKDLAPSVQTWNPQPDSYTLVESGAADLAVGWNARAQIYRDKSGGKLGVALPEEGSVFQINTINLVNDSKNSDAAQTFINYALSPEAQASFTETMFYAPVNTKAKPSADATARTATSQDREGKMIEVDWSFVAQHRDEWTNVWRRQIIGS